MTTIHRDQIYLQRLAVETVIGVLDWERTQPQTLYLTLSLTLDTLPASLDEDLSRSVSYAEVAQWLRDHLGEHHYLLLETLGNRVCAALLDAYPLIQAVSLSIDKPDVVPGCEGIGIRLFRERSS
ncbi:MAG: dihydroneopterin aldolase [Pseudomonadota bacterium]